jgi:hypothetical protein
MCRLRLAPRLVAVLATHLTAASVLILAIGGVAQAVTVFSGRSLLRAAFLPFVFSAVLFGG